MERKPYYGSGNRGGSVGANRRPTAGARSSSSVQNGNYRQYGANHRPQQNSGGRRPAQEDYYARQRRQPPRRRRKKDPLARFVPLAVLACILAGAIYIGSAWITATLNKSTYCDNIYINGIEITHFHKEEGLQYARDQISSRLNSTYTLYFGDEQWSFTPADFNASINTDTLMERAWNIGHVGSFMDRAKDIRSLKENPIYLTATLEYDESLISAYVDTLYNDVYTAPEDAVVVADLEQPYLTAESSRGQELDRETALEQIISLVETGEGSTELPMIILEPTLSTDDALMTLEIAAEYKTDTSFRGSSSRYNVRKALSYFNGLTVHPGDTIDFNAIVGPRTKQRGWKSATEYAGNTTTEGYGGGVCQASTTLYGAILKAGMTVIQRHPHSMTVSYVDPSLDAAVTDTNKNLIFRNDTDYAIRIFTEVTKEYASVTIYGKKPEYRYELYSNIVSQDTTAVRVAYIDDTEGKYCFYKDDPPVLYKKGLAALTSDGYLIGYDWETNVEVTSTWLSHDQYESGTDIYWRGVHSPNEMMLQNEALADSF